MFSEKTKALLFAGWVILVGLTAVVIGITSVPNWLVVACVAVVPPWVVRRLWHAPEQTTSERIHDARQ